MADVTIHDDDNPDGRPATDQEITMCSNGPTTSYGYELSPGDEADLDDTPRCCGGDMTAGKPDQDGDRDYVCDGGGCGTRVSITGTGMVLDILEPA